MTFRAAVRAAAVDLLEAYKASDEDAIRQIYPGRPLSISPPCAFVDTINEPDISYTPAGTQRTPLVTVRVVKGSFDSADTVAAQDDLVDGFIAFVVDNRHSAGASTLFLVESVEDEPGWIPEWMAPEHQRAYYSTLIGLRGEGLFGGLV